MEYVKFKDVAKFTTGKLNSNAAIENGKYNFFTCAPEPLKTNTYSFDKEAILLAGNNADGNFHINLYEGKFDVYQRTYVIDVIDRNKLNLKYLYYVLKMNLAHLKNISRGTSTKFLTATIINDFDIPFPCIDVQNKIAKILNDLDLKIKNNNEVNDCLARLCNDIFHNYLNKYEDKIEYKKIIEIAKRVITGKTPSTKNKDFWDGSIPFITIPDMHKQIFTINTERNITELGAKSIIPKNSISVSCIATIGLVSISTEESQTNQQINSIILNNSYELYFLYEYLSEQKEFLKSIAGGSTTYNINKNTFENIEIPYLPKDILVNYNSDVTNMFEKIKNNQYENKELSNMRDNLLSKLMNGIIDISNINI